MPDRLGPVDRRWRLLLIALLAWAAPVYAQSADASVDELMRILAQRTHGEVNFSERQYVGMLDKPVQSSGVLIYSAPAHLEKRTLQPKPASLIVDGNTLTVRRGKRTHVLDLHDYPQVAPFVESIRATLAGDRAALETNFNLALAGPLSNWVLTLEPKNEALRKYVARIQIAGKRGSLDSVTVSQADGDRSVMTIDTPKAQ